jgi:hypothetical protein
MTNEFCSRTARKIRKFGYAKKEAARYSRFVYLSMLSVGGIIAGLHRKAGQRSLCDETSQPLRHTFARFIVAHQETTGTGTSSGPRAVDERARSFRLRRH